MDYLFVIGSDRAAETMRPADIVWRAAWQLGSVGLRLVDQSKIFTSPGEPDGAGPPVTLTAVVAASDHTVPATLERAARVPASTAAEGGLWIEAVAAADVIYPDDVTVARAVEGTDLPAPMLPHPGLHREARLLVPAAAVWPDWRHPILSKSLGELAKRLPQATRDAVRPEDHEEPRRNVAE